MNYAAQIEGRRVLAAREFSTRADIVTRRTYNRPLNEEGTKFETWEQTIDRVIGHQRWLWERALTHQRIPGMPLHDVTEDLREWEGLNFEQEAELNFLREIFLERMALPAGRTLWLGGTDIAKRREASQFNCSHTNIETVYDFVDVFWLLMQGCGVGGTPIVGTLNGFRKPIPNIDVIRSKRSNKGRDYNEEDFTDGVWTISIGDSAEAWAKAVGKLLAGKYKAHTLVFDLSQIRPAGYRLKGYGWISSGDESIAKAFPAIAEILNRRAGNLLSKIDILDIFNWLGTVLSSRRSAEIALMDYNDLEWYDFATAKKDYYVLGNNHRQQSNNSLVFYNRPERKELERIFEIMVDSGGSEPGFVNGDAALKRAPWFKGLNPCAEILLSNKSFCNLTEVDVSRFKGESALLHKTMEAIARANYRQTAVDFRDGILQEAWHLNNEFLRLCGTGVTGIVQRDDMTEYDWKSLRYTAVTGARSMAKELGLQHPKNVTTVKPSGTVSKIMDTTEGVHKPLGKYIFNWINFSNKDPLVDRLIKANYRNIPNPGDPTGTLVCMPVKYDNIKFDVVLKNINGKEEECHVNLDSAVSQLERYKKIQKFYVDHNVSITVSYDVDEVPQIVEWLLNNWDDYVATSFLFRNDPTKTAKDLGYSYLPQEVVTERQYEDYVNTLFPISFEDTETFLELDEDECATGACPIK